MRQVNEPQTLTDQLRQNLGEHFTYTYHQFLPENGEQVESTLEMADLLVEADPALSQDDGTTWRRIWSPLLDQERLGDSSAGWLVTSSVVTIVLVRDGWNRDVAAVDPVIRLRSNQSLSGLEMALSEALDRWLEKRGFKYEAVATHYKQSWAERGIYKRQIEFDFWLWGALVGLPGDVAIECQGAAHHAPDHWFNLPENRSENCRSIEERDQTKREFCEERRIVFFEMSQPSDVEWIISTLDEMVKL